MSDAGPFYAVCCLQKMASGTGRCPYELHARSAPELARQLTAMASHHAAAHGVKGCRMFVIRHSGLETCDHEPPRKEGHP